MRWPTNPAAGLLVLRLAIGLVFFLHGWAKLFGQEISFVQEMLAMAGWSVPDVLLWLVAILELIGGIALIAGLFTRYFAAALALEMVVAVVLFYARQGFFIVAVPNVPLAFGFEYQVALVGALLCLALGGPGAWSVRGRLRRGEPE